LQISGGNITPQMRDAITKALPELRTFECEGEWAMTDQAVSEAIAE